jgi:hypothetical protein
MKIISLYSGSDGESHFKEVELPYDIRDGVRRDYVGKGRKVRDIFVRADENVDNGLWHTARHAHYLAVLKGEVEVQVADGSKRRWGPGDILLAEDTTGHGHVVRKSNLTSLIVLLD